MTFTTTTGFRKVLQIASNVRRFCKLEILLSFRYADDIMQAAFDGTAVASTGFEFSGAVTGSDAFRSQAIKKGVLYLNVFMYTIWEMQDAINDCIAGDLTTNTGAVHVTFHSP